MKKKSTAKQTQLLSPENYIRQKSKYLPLGECFVTEDWEESKICHVVITRKHVNGNVTSCMYLVDLGCLGVKDTIYQFNVPFYEVKEFMKKNEDRGVRFINVPYELAHNIIYASIDYAEEYGFKPYKEYSSITCHFLEEDTDAVPLIEIQCGGNDGNPLYVNSGFDSPARVKEILAQLEKTAGKGNYHFIMNPEEEEDDGYDYDYDEYELNNKIKTELLSLSEGEQKKLLVALILKTEGKEISNQEDLLRLMALSNIISCNMAGDEAIDEQLSLLETKFERSIVEEDELPNSLFSGIQNCDVETITDLFFNAFDEIFDDKNPKKTIESIRKTAGDVPVADFLELYYLKEKNSKKLKSFIEKYHQKHPDYFLIQLLRYEFPDKEENYDIEKLEKLFSENEEAITYFEADYYFIVYTMYLLTDKNVELSTLLAFSEYILELDCLSDDSYKTIKSTLSLGIIHKIIFHWEKTGELDQLMDKKFF